MGGTAQPGSRCCRGRFGGPRLPPRADAGAGDGEGCDGGEGLRSGPLSFVLRSLVRRRLLDGEPYAGGEVRAAGVRHPARVGYALAVVQPLPTGYVFDPADPRAPAIDQWERMPPDERARVVAMLPAEVPLELLPNEGDPHRKAKRGALDALDGFFRRTGRRIYLSSEISRLLPGRAPLRARPARRHRRRAPRSHRAGSSPTEGKGLDFVLEVHVAGDRRKDEKTNVERYARLGIQEYFYFDRTRLRLAGYRLPSRLRARLPAHRAAGRPLRVRRARPRSRARRPPGSASSPATRRSRTPTR